MNSIYITGTDEQIAAHEMKRFLRFLPVAATAVVLLLACL